MIVRKAVIPTAGLGTRFLPATRSVPKVMFPILDTPAIHFSVEEAAQAGIEQIVIVISHGQEVIGRYFDRLPDLEEVLAQRGDPGILERMAGISNMAEIKYVYQKQQLGLGHAISTARPAIGDEPFAVLLPDDLILSDKPTLATMTDIFNCYGSSVIAVKEVSEEAVPTLGIVDHNPIDSKVSSINAMVEKPRLADAPSNLAIIGRYVLTPQVFDALADLGPGALGEIQLTDAIARLLPSQGAYAYRFSGEHFDVGTPQGLLKASVYAALHRDEISDDLRSWISLVL